MDVFRLSAINKCTLQSTASPTVGCNAAFASSPAEICFSIAGHTGRSSSAEGEGGRPKQSAACSDVQRRKLFEMSKRQWNTKSSMHMKIWQEAWRCPKQRNQREVRSKTKNRTSTCDTQTIRRVYEWTDYAHSRHNTYVAQYVSDTKCS